MNELIRRLSIIGCKSVTITGGGEPLLYPQINELIARCYDFGIQVGLVTNGTLFEKLISRVYDTIVWCRISHSDERLLSNTYAKQIEQAIKSGPRIAWAFSYVVSKEPKIDNIKAVVKFAVDHGFTHVRLVADLTDPAAVPMDKIRESIKDPIVIIQDRASPEKGSNCYIAYLKPVISADGKIYRCCGAQYALDQGQKALPNELCMGELKDLEGALRNYTTATQGLQCKYCYYGAYNRVLQSMITKLTHEAFV
jgi:organic radical activating enzyme